MKIYIVLYRNNTNHLGQPLGFICCAANSDEAEIQLYTAHEGATVVWVFEGSDYQLALKDFYTQSGDLTD